MEHPVVPTLLMKIYRENGMAPPRCSGDHSRPCRGRLRIDRGKSRAPVLPRVAGRLLPAPASVVAGPVFVTCCRPGSRSHFRRSLHAFALPADQLHAVHHDRLANHLVYIYSWISGAMVIFLD